MNQHQHGLALLPEKSLSSVGVYTHVLAYVYVCVFFFQTELVEELSRLRGNRADQTITDDDVVTSLKHLQVLGNGLRTVTVSGSQFVLSVRLT